MSEQCTVSRSRRYLWTMIMTAFLGAFLCGNGCEKSGAENVNGQGDGKKDRLLCLECGQVKGEELCCKQDQIKCPKCGLAKDSPGCCRIPEGTKAAWICGNCDRVVTDKACCKCKQGRCPIDEFIHDHQVPVLPR